MLDSSGAGAGAYAFLQWLPSPATFIHQHICLRHKANIILVKEQKGAEMLIHNTSQDRGIMVPMS